MLIARKFGRPYCGQHKLVPGKVLVEHWDFQMVTQPPWEIQKLLQSSTQDRAEPGVAFASGAAAAIDTALRTCQKIHRN